MPKHISNAYTHLSHLSHFHTATYIMIFHIFLIDQEWIHIIETMDVSQ